MAEFDVDEMLKRFEERAQAVRDRSMPPVEGEARKGFIKQAETDLVDFSLIANARWELDDGFLVLRVPLS